MPDYGTWRTALERALWCNNPALLVELLRGDAIADAQCCAWINWFIAWSAFKDLKGRKIDRSKFRGLIDKLCGASATDSEIREQLARFLSTVRIGRRYVGNVPVPPWKSLDSTRENQFRIDAGKSPSTLLAN